MKAFRLRNLSYCASQAQPFFVSRGRETARLQPLSFYCCTMLPPKQISTPPPPGKNLHENMIHLKMRITASRLD